jgi:hypothetical protein
MLQDSSMAVIPRGGIRLASPDSRSSPGRAPGAIARGGPPRRFAGPCPPGSGPHRSLTTGRTLWGEYCQQHDEQHQPGSFATASRGVLRCSDSRLRRSAPVRFPWQLLRHRSLPLLTLGTHHRRTVEPMTENAQSHAPGIDARDRHNQVQTHRFCAVKEPGPVHR